MSSVAELAPVLVWMSDANKRCTYVNAEWTAFTGLGMEAALADGWRGVIHADDIPPCLEVLTAAFEARQPFTLDTGSGGTTANIDGSSITAFRY